MEEQEKKQKPEFKGNLGFIWLTGILVILLGCTVVYTLKIAKENKELKQTPTEISEQQSQALIQNANLVDSENNEATIDNITVLKDNNNSNTGTTNKKIYTEGDKKEIKETIENYYKLLTAKDNSPLLMLTDVLDFTVQAVQDPDYAPSNYLEHPNPYKYAWTGIKYKEFRGEIWYISDDVLKKNFSEFVEYKDYLYLEDNNIRKYNFEYKIVKQEINENSKKDNCICDVTVKNSKTGKTFKNRIKMSRGNGNFVIGKVEKI